MNPYEHFFWNYAIFYRKPWAWKVGLGGVFPDLIYMVAFIPKLFSYQSFQEWMMDPLWDKVRIKNDPLFLRLSHAGIAGSHNHVIFISRRQIRIEFKFLWE